MPCDAHQSTEQRLLRLLSQWAGEYLTGVALGRELDISRNAVWKHIQGLRKRGYTVESCQHRGYRLVGWPDIPNQLETARYLDTSSFGYPLFYADTSSSTNDWAKQLAEKNAPEGAVAVADKQEQGKGRSGRDWFSPPRDNLYFSLILRPRLPPWRVGELSLVMASAIVVTLQKRFPDGGLALKWPNDILSGNKKLGGVLCEMASELDGVRYIVIGTGLNVNLSPDRLPVTLREYSSSLKCIKGEQVRRVPLFAELLKGMEEFYKTWRDEGFEPIRDLWPALSADYGTFVSLQTSTGTTRGKAAGIDEHGALLLETEDKEYQRFYSGDVHVDRWNG